MHALILGNSDLPLAEQLAAAGVHATWTRVTTEADYSAALHPPLDVVVADWEHPQLSANRALELLRASGLDAVFIVVCEASHEQAAFQLLPIGATDCVGKDRLFRLTEAIDRGMQAKKLRAELAHAEEELRQGEARHQMMLTHLRQSEALYRSVVEGAMEGLAIHQDGIIRFANRAAARMAGCDDPAELVGQNIWEAFVAPEVRAELQARCDACLRGQVQAMHRGWPGVRRDGRRVWVQSSVTLITWQGQPAFLSYFSDITERKQAEESLRASEERFSKAFHGSPLPVSIVTVKEGRYIDANTSLARMLGRSREEIIGQTAIGLGLWPDPAKRTELVDMISKNAVVRNFETQLRMKHGELRDVLISAELIQLGGERCMIVVTQDMTEQRRLEEQFRQAQKMEAVGRLAGGLAHDFNNLLTIIQGHAALLRDDRSTPEMILDAADQISSATERAASLTRQLLMFSRRQVMQLRDLDINEIIDRTGQMLRRILGEDIELVFQYGPALPLVRADSGMMEQVLLNLAVNSRDAMPKGGQLLIATSAQVIDEAAAQELGAEASQVLVCLTVRDTGCGISPENMNRLFEPFFTTKPVGKGTGLGLATAYGIVKQHRGWIRATSELGRGTTFQIYLPESRKAAPAPPFAPNEPPFRGGNEGILLVEDEEALRNLVRILLERHGYRVFEASCGKTALDVWAEHKKSIQLILTDLVMPGGMSGQGLAEQILREDPKIKIIYSSGYSADVIAKDLVLEEGIRFLQKPYDPRLLTSTIRACLDAC